MYHVVGRHHTLTMNSFAESILKLLGGNMQFSSSYFIQTLKVLFVSILSIAVLGTSVATPTSKDDSVNRLMALETRAGAQRILLFTKTAGFTHGSIPTAINAITNAAEQAGFLVDQSNDASLFNATDLANYDAVVFLLTSGNVLNDSQQAAFETFIQAGNGYAGVHSASDTEYQWPWYGGLVGAYFNGHPSIQQANVLVEDFSHPSTTGLNPTWVRTDEWYNFDINPRGTVNVLATVDESTYNGGNMGADHPIAWYHEYDGGRSWYTAGGHTNNSYGDPDFIAHILGGITYAAGAGTDIDTDGDSIVDAQDNCQTFANSDQRDSNGDGFGNLCDADLNNDCTTNFQDLALLSDNFLGSDADSDLNGDGVVNFLDINLFSQLFLSAPGPSGLAECVAEPLSTRHSQRF